MVFRGDDFIVAIGTIIPPTGTEGNKIFRSMIKNVYYFD
jgi:hypothetical protein